MFEYKLFKKELNNGKKRNIYKKKGSNKQYIKSKGKMINLAKYKKLIKNKKLKKGGSGSNELTKSGSNKSKYDIVDSSKQSIKNKTDLSKILQDPPTPQRKYLEDISSSSNKIEDNKRVRTYV